jgi:hypothetical protein
MAWEIAKELTPEEMLSFFDKYLNDLIKGKERKIIRLDFPPGASPEEIAKAINDIRKKYRKGSEPEKQ